MPSCVAYGCSNRTPVKGVAPVKGLTFHKIPKDEVLRKQWITAIRRKGWTPSKWSRICSEHFRPEDFDRTSVSSTRIRQNAVPSVFPAFPLYLQKALEKRRALEKHGAHDFRKRVIERPAENENQSPLLDISCATLQVNESVEKTIAQLQKKFEEVEKRNEDLKKKMKILQQTNRRLKKRNTVLSSEVSKLKRNQPQIPKSSPLSEETLGIAKIILELPSMSQVSVCSEQPAPQQLEPQGF